MLGHSLTSHGMTSSGIGDPPSNLPLTGSSKVLQPRRSSSRQTPPAHSASRLTALTSPPVRSSPKCVPPMVSGTRLRSFLNPCHRLNATTRSMTRRCLRSSEPYKSGAISSKGLNTEHQFEIWTNHKNLEYFMSAKQLNRRQARWSLYLAQFNFLLHHKPGKSMGKPDALSWRADHGTHIGQCNNYLTYLNVVINDITLITVAAGLSLKQHLSHRSRCSLIGYKVTWLELSGSFACDSVPHGHCWVTWFPWYLPWPSAVMVPVTYRPLLWDSGCAVAKLAEKFSKVNLTKNVSLLQL